MFHRTPKIKLGLQYTTKRLILNKITKYFKSMNRAIVHRLVFKLCVRYLGYVSNSLHLVYVLIS